MRAICTGKVVKVQKRQTEMCLKEESIPFRTAQKKVVCMQNIRASLEHWRAVFVRECCKVCKSINLERRLA